ncbi:hypothetical protein [Streptomyces sp. PT19]|uniref:hypothetical protein n=1 Tax=Streptomyces sp. PT19 TaxID=3452239 RepID=UPI003F7FEA6D
MPIFNSTHDLFLTLHRSGHLDRLKTALGAFETTSRDSPFYEGFNFTACHHPGKCATCLSGWISIYPRSADLRVTVRRVPADQWMTALHALVPAHQPAAPATSHPFSLGPLDGAPGWEKRTSFIPGCTNGHLTISPAISADTYFKDHTDPGFATLSITPGAREHCEPAWDQGTRFLTTLASAATQDTAAPGRTAVLH